MDLHKIEIFCTLIKLRSFSRTAESLFLTQPTVSGHIKNLETDLGVKLVDRLGRRVVPTEAGEGPVPLRSEADRTSRPGAAGDRGRLR